MKKARLSSLCLLGTLILTVATCGSFITSANAATTVSVLSWKKVSCPCITPEVSGKKVSADVGNGLTVTWTKGTPLNIAWFQQAQTNTYLEAVTTGIQAAAKAVGATVTMFDADFSAETQQTQIQNAIASGKYNAAIVLPVASQGSCTQLTHDLPAANIPVIVVAQQTCGRDSDSGAALYSPGTVSWIGNDWNLYYQAWSNAAAKSLTSPTQAIVVGGPAGNGPSNSAATAVMKSSKKYSNLKVVGYARTDYTTAVTLTDTQNLLEAHPNVKAVLLQYGGSITGVTQAIAQAGLTGKVKVYDAGGSQAEVALIKSGALAQTVADFPYTMGYTSVQMMQALWNGKPVPRVVLNSGHTAPSSPNTQTGVIITKKNVSSYKPEY